METIVISHDAPLVVIVGPTASGKTSLAIQLASRFHGEIISADSRAIFKYMDIGTAKPTIRERQQIPHWGIDIVNPDEQFTAVDFQRYAHHKIKEIRQRGHVPFLVGGTGLYINSIIYDYQFPELDKALLSRRSELEGWTMEALHTYCAENNIELPENSMNKRYVVNNILRRNTKHKRQAEPLANCIVIGITTEKTMLWSRIESRSVEMWSSGLLDEAIDLAGRYGWNSEAMTGNAYRIAKQYIDGSITEDEAKIRLTASDRQLAKRQLTWFRRDEHITWLAIDDAYTYIAQRLAARINS